MPFIKETFQLAATDADVLAAPSRLTSIPADGVLTIECSATQGNPTNNGQLTIQLPGGDTPVENVIIPQNGFSTSDSVIHDDTALQFQFSVAQGGHVGISYTETGTVTAVLFIVTLEF